LNSIEMYRYPGCTLHQIGPYIGKVRPNLARQLVLKYSQEGDWVWDPFCGSGTIPLECRLLSRHVLAADTNPYARALTRAKLYAPTSESNCLAKLSLAIKSLENEPPRALNEVPQWVKSFFHEQTLKETMSLIAHFISRKQYFYIGCLLGILHHQRPGFLSYPASHLVPYLRNKLYPRDQFPEAYEYRDPIPRLQAKIKRMLKYAPPALTSRFKVMQKSAVKKYLPNDSVDVVITSPPYMDALDYGRDNRLRLWFLNVNNYELIKDNEIRRIRTFKEDMSIALRMISDAIRPGGVCVLILGDLTRANKRYDVPTMVSHLVETEVKDLGLENQWVESIPPQRRARRNGRATQTETILVFRCRRK